VSSSELPKVGSAPSGFILSTPVWGAGHLNLFLSVGLPSLLSPGNLPAFAANANCRYRIYTRPSERALLEASSTFQQTKALLPIEIIDIEEEITVPHRTMSDCHIDTMGLADREDAAAVFVPPDCVWSDGSLKRLLTIANSGKSVVHMCGIRLDRDAVVPQLAEHATDGGRVLSLQPRALVGMALNHLHPIAYSHFWNEYDGGLMPANLMWTVPSEGLLLRCFHLHPLMVKSQVPFAKFSSTIDDDLVLYACPDKTRDHVVTDSDEILVFELSGLDRQVGTACNKNSAIGVASWAESGTNERHRFLIESAICVHSTPMTPTIWSARIGESQRVVDRVRKLNHLSTAGLLTRGEFRVASGRMVAASLGRGTAGATATLWARTLRNVRSAIETFNASMYRRLFISGSHLTVCHPFWLQQRSIRDAVVGCLGAADRSVALIGAGPGLAYELEQMRPDLSIFQLDDALPPDSSFDSLSREVTVAIAVQPFETGSAEAPPALVALSNKGVKCYLLRAGATRQDDQVLWSPRSAGGLGTRLSSYLSSATKRVQSRPQNAVAATGLLRLVLRFLTLVLKPVVYLFVAFCGLLLNGLGFILDRMTAPPPNTELRGQEAFVAHQARKGRQE
jgi:hypothetical protein